MIIDVNVFLFAGTFNMKSLLENNGALLKPILKSIPADERPAVGMPLPNIPWEERPKNCAEPVWRYSRNPIIPRDLTSTSNSIFNSAAVPFEGGFAGVFRCDDKQRRMGLYAGKSDDGINWRIESTPIRFRCDDPEIAKWEYGYDPRVCWIDDRFYITWCNGYHGPTIGIGWTRDFE